MNAKKSLIENLSKEQKEFIQNLDNETIARIHIDREEALKYAETGIKQTEPEKLNPDHLEKVADYMQILARIVLSERGVSTKN